MRNSECVHNSVHEKPQKERASPCGALTSYDGDHEKYYSHCSRNPCASALARLVKSTYSLKKHSPQEKRLVRALPHHSPASQFNKQHRAERKAKERGRAQRGKT